VGSSVRAFTVRHPDGGDATLPANDPDAKFVVVAFISFECPVAKSYLAPLADLKKAYAGKGVSFAAICPDEGAAEVKRQAAEFKLAVPAYADPQLKAVRELGAERVPEVFVLDSKGVIRYRGRIDDRWITPGKQNPRMATPDLANALDELLAGKRVTVERTPTVGCPVGPVESGQASPTKGKGATFHKDVLPILQNRCQDCHRPGEAGPFSLLTYKQAAKWGDRLKEYTANGAMPPWKPTAGPAFQNERRMPKSEIETIAAWVDAGCPEGDVKEAPPAKVFAAGSEWQFGPPDLIAEMPAEFELGATGPDHFRAIVMKHDPILRDKMIAAYEVKAGNPRIVHHLINYFDTTGQAAELAKVELARKKEPNETDRGPGYTSAMGIGFTSLRPNAIGGIGGWTPGQRGFKLPAGTGYVLPKGAEVVVQMHYHRNGRPETDRTRIGFYFAKDPAALKPLNLLVVPGLVCPSNGFKPFKIIPKGREFEVRGAVITEQDCTIHSILPHMHMLGKNVTVTMTPPDGQERTLVEIRDWDYNWQEGYFFKEPIAVKTGTRFEIRAVFDNSAANPNNPFNPPRDAKKGEETTDEMLFGFIRATSEQPGTAMIKVKYLTEAKDYAPAKK
jgi:mono/diheme cytochrome c family protein